MQMSPRNKIYFGLVACGVAALVTDRLTRSPEESAASASAVSPSSLLIARGERSTPASPSSQPAARDTTVAELLRSAAHRSGWCMSESSGSHNPFANDDAATNPQIAKPSQTAATFPQAHHLTAVITTDGQSNAMVDGQICSVGKDLDGFVLVSISLRSATFQCGHERAVLVMPGYSPAPTPQRVGRPALSDVP